VEGRQIAATSVPVEQLRRLALEVGIPEARQLVRDGLNPGESAETLKQRLEILADYPDPQSVPLLMELFESQQPDEVLGAALKAVQPYIDDQVTQRVLNRYAGLSETVRSRARDLLFSRPDSSLALLKAVEGRQIAATSVPVEQLRRLALFENDEINTLVRRHWGNIQPGTPEEKLADIRRFTNDLRAGAGDAAPGKALFDKQCGTCHKLRDAGAILGPDLTSTVKGDLVSLLANIVDPSAVVRREFLSYVVVLKTGAVSTGVLVEEDAASVTLADAKNQRVRIPRDQIEEISASATSIMPERLLQQLSPQELRDLFAYLRL